MLKTIYEIATGKDITKSIYKENASHLEAE